MNPEPEQQDEIDWYATTWEGSRRRQIEAWSKLTLDEIFEAQEEMARFAEEIAKSPAVRPGGQL